MFSLVRNYNLIDKLLSFWFLGKWIGFGGKVEPNESILEGAIREVKEECGLDLEPKDIKKLGVIDYEFDKIYIEGHIFEVQNYYGEIEESEEMEPKWFEIENMPYDKMWKADEFWHPYFFRQQLFKAYSMYDHLGDVLMHYSYPVENL